jgi:hypothetical protein
MILRIVVLGSLIALAAMALLVLPQWLWTL